MLLPDFLNGNWLDAALMEDIAIVTGSKTGILGKVYVKKKISSFLSLYINIYIYIYIHI